MWQLGARETPSSISLETFGPLNSFLQSSSLLQLTLGHAYLRVSTELKVPDGDPIAFQFFVENRWVRKSIF